MGYMPHCDLVEQHIGRKLTRYQIGSLICDAWNKSVTVGNSTKGFKVTGIFPFINKALRDHLFYALADSEVPVPENTAQEEANSSSKVLINTPQINSQPAQFGTSSAKPPSPIKHLHKISPIRKLIQVTAKHRIKKTSVLLTSIDNRNELKANLEKTFQKCKKINKKYDKTTKRKLNFDSAGGSHDSSSDVVECSNSIKFTTPREKKGKMKKSEGEERCKSR
ncbi:hypothetical protein AVEN_274471-1 [Araneus ventricosus]|uniref:Uncharacterized protein n=1 Tax=Araneus ventricosus TaxID=182803 RepID=A0A4Y2HCP0_ARAVE|nr:hypothetical protein AVEN_274471-1 [Araneus ventricosus]